MFKKSASGKVVSTKLGVFIIVVFALLTFGSAFIYKILPSLRAVD